MRAFSEVCAALRRAGRAQYSLLTGCCFFSTLLITAYSCMMRSPTILSVLPEGGDSRKQVMMVFALSVLGCAVFTLYAAGLFFRQKSREVGVLLALGASKPQVRNVLARELAALTLLACAAGGALGGPLAWLLWRFFRLAVVDSEEMALSFDPAAYAFPAAFAVFVVVMLTIMLARFIRRTNIIDIVSESRRSEPIRDVPRWYGPAGVALIAFGGALGYLTPTFCVKVLHWYAPEGLTALTYLPALAGLYMLLLHTVVNGGRRDSRYRHILTTSMMRFQGRQTVRNMVVVTVLIAGAYFASFYTPMLGTGSLMAYDNRKIDYSFHYRADQDMIDRAGIEAMADEMGVTITRYAEVPAARLAVDGWTQIETETALGVTWEKEYREQLESGLFLSESAYTALTGEPVDLAPGTVATVCDDDGSGQYRVNTEISVITNALTGEQLAVTPAPSLRSTQFFGRRVLDDADYARLTAGLPDDWRETEVAFNVENIEGTYDFAKRLFNEIVDRSDESVEVYDAWDPVVKMQMDAAGEEYFFDNENLDKHGFERIEYDKRDSSNFRLYWQYMPTFRVLDRADFFRTLAVFLTLFIFIAVLCFAAVVVILFTRCMTIAQLNARVYEDLRRLGASERYLRRSVREQISRVFVAPIATGTLLIYCFYGMIMYCNDNRFSPGELMGLLNCALLVAALTALLYAVYRFTLCRVCAALGLAAKAKS